MANPYEPPKDSLERYLSRGAAEEMRGGMASELSIQLLRETRPWVMAMSIVLFVITFLVASLSLVVLIFAPSDGKMPKAAIAISYFVLSGFYVYPGIKLWKYSQRITQLTATRAIGDLHGALEEQKSFWKYSGITTLIVIGIYVLVFVVAMIAGITTAMTR